MQNSSLPPEIPKQSLTPLWMGVGVVVVIIGVVWALASRTPEKKEAKPEAAAGTTPSAAAPAPAPAEPSPVPPPPPPLEHGLPPPPPVAAIPGDAVASATQAPSASPARRDPNCDDPCVGRETAELLSSLRTKAGQARSCYERALANDSALAGKLEIRLRVGANGSACSASVANATLSDAAVKTCALGRFRSGKYPKPTGGCVDVSVPMNFMPAGSR